jgi:hypothetical protein
VVVGEVEADLVIVVLVLLSFVFFLKHHQVDS